MEEVNRQFVAAFERRAKTRRGYADERFEWPEKDLKEWYVGRRFAESAKLSGEMIISKVRMFKPDPPDCVAIGADGESLAIEASEVVCGEAIRQTRRGEKVWATWDAENLFKACSERLLEKDAKSYNGGPYARVILLLYTDEPEITPELVCDVFSSRSFSKPRKITDAYLMLRPVLTTPPPGETVEAVCPIFKMRFQ